MTDRRSYGARRTALLLGVLLCSTAIPLQSPSQPLANGKSKFLGNIIGGAIPSNFAQYWNQVTPENAGKWGSVESTQGSFNWTPLDNIYNYAVNNHFPYKHHNLVWGQQQPSWITSLDSASQRAAIENWIDSVGARYPYTSFVDVVNEPIHTPPSYINALGGAGKTGWDWVVTAFAMARKAFFPGIKLLLNEYSVIGSNQVTSEYLALVDTLRVRGLIDGIGIQGHYFELRGSSTSVLKYNLDRLAATGLPVYISEFDINESDDNLQLQNYQTYFPLFWEDPGMKGMTLWGYIQGQIWQTNAYLVRSDGTERPALQWLRHYLAVPLRPTLVSPLGTAMTSRNPLLVWRSSASATSYHVQVSNSSGFSNFSVDSTVADTLFQVDSLAANTPFYWRVSASNDSGQSAFSDLGSFTTGDQIEAVGEPVEAPAEIALSQNYPNPFNPTTRINYTVRRSGFVALNVYDLMGQKVATLVAGVRQPGTYSVTFTGNSLSSGVYFYRLQTDGVSITKTLLLLK